MNAQHSSAKSTWYTPLDILRAARTVLGPIDLDPASDVEGNTLVEAARYITAFEDGLTAGWSDGTPVTIWLNPPGTLRKPKGHRAGPEQRPLPKLFWEKLMRLRDAGMLRHAIVAAFSLEQFQQSQNWQGLAMIELPFCIPSKRTKWLPGQGEEADDPTHAAAFVYVPGILDGTTAFVREFEMFGGVVVPR